jgi:hypothetical protein
MFLRVNPVLGAAGTVSLLLSFATTSMTTFWDILLRLILEILWWYRCR